MFTITDLGMTSELARGLATTNVIESPNSVVRRLEGPDKRSSPQRPAIQEGRIIFMTTDSNLQLRVRDIAER